MSNDVKMLIGIGVLTVVIVIAAAFTIGNKPGPVDQQQQPQRVLSASEENVLVRKDMHITGNSKAKVMVVEFGDYECPACGVAEPIVKKILNEFKGKVAFAFRQFPLSIHKNGYNAALAAETAGAQGKFWEMHQTLYENQKDWVDLDNPLSVYAKYASSIGINVDQFKKDYQAKTYDVRVKTDLNDGNSLGIDSTPTFFVNGAETPGIIAYDDFKKLINTDLKK